jgi:DNA mismatch repair ATPase MutS
MDDGVDLPKVCKKLRKLESTLKKVVEIRRIIESLPLLFDEEDLAAVVKIQNEAQINLANQAVLMDMPPSIAYAATFAESVNARLPILRQIRGVEESELTLYFENKQRRLALQAEDMLRISAKENAGFVQPGT